MHFAPLGKRYLRLASCDFFKNRWCGRSSWPGREWLLDAVHWVLPSVGWIRHQDKVESSSPPSSPTAGLDLSPSSEVSASLPSPCFPLGGGRADRQAGQHGVGGERRRELPGALRPAVSCLSPGTPRRGRGEVGVLPLLGWLQRVGMRTDPGGSWWHHDSTLSGTAVVH